MAKKLQRRKTTHPSINQVTAFNQSGVTPNSAVEAAIPAGGTLKKASDTLNGADKYQSVKNDLKLSLIVGAGIFALMAILYFVLH